MTKYLADVGDVNVAIKGIDNLAKVLSEHTRDDAVISISHKLYGDQKIKCKMDCIVDENRIGFRVKSGQEIYLYKEEIKYIYVSNNVFFSDDVMQVNIQFK